MRALGPPGWIFLPPSPLLVLSWSTAANPEPSGPGTASLAPGRAAHLGVLGIKQQLRIRALGECGGQDRRVHRWTGCLVSKGRPDQSLL